MKRLDYQTVSPSAFRALLGLEKHVRGSGLDRGLVELVYLRVSQRNGCAFCVDMHAKDLRAAGETNERLDGLVAWRESPFYTPRERAALRYAEAVTALGPEAIDDATFDEARSTFGEADLVELTLAIACINAWNRMAIAFRSEAGTYRPEAR